MNYIVTTTIYEPSETILILSKRKDWKLIVVGDLKTPHHLYHNIDNIIYLDPDFQEKNYKELSDAIGWNCIQRRNIGFIEAYKRGAEIVATIDDDNIPYENWGTNLMVGKDVWVDLYKSNYGVLDPMKLTNHPELWHRGYPLLQLRNANKVSYLGKVKRTVLVQADLWDGDPDVDAICRAMYNTTQLSLEIKAPFTTDDLVPFNSQNTFIHRSLIPSYMVFPHIGRADDIWGAYHLEMITGVRPVFCKPSVYQKRNPQLFMDNFSKEVYSYENTMRFLYLEKLSILPEETKIAWDLYKKSYENLIYRE